jgi:hypothetical protein
MLANIFATETDAIKETKPKVTHRIAPHISSQTVGDYMQNTRSNWLIRCGGAKKDHIHHFSLSPVHC